MPVKDGDKVKVDYKGTLDDGTIFDQTQGSKCDDEPEEKDDCDCGCNCNSGPFEFEVGCGQVIAGFDESVKGMEVGEEKEFKIAPADAYGEHDPNLIQNIPKDQFPPDAAIEEGMALLIETPQGQRMPAKIVSINDEEVGLDINHPLAGENLNFWIKVVEIDSS